MKPVSQVFLSSIYTIYVRGCNTLAYLKDKSTCVYQRKNLSKHVKQVLIFYLATDQNLQSGIKANNL